MTDQEKLNRIADCLQEAYNYMTGIEGFDDLGDAIGWVAEAKAIAEGDMGSFDLTGKEYDDE